ncbi:MAG: protein kinase [Deltaproteobacteria bacterium]|nr:protein kinase [Deltaproteobacteria bacterium]
MAAPRQDRIGRYELLIELGRGGMAELFLGRLLGAGGFAKLVAIKRILPHFAQDQQFKEMFLNEGRIAAQLSHPNVCQVFELAEIDDELVLAMEYLDGVTWDVLVAASPPGAETLRIATGVLAQAAEGLHYAHTLRDVEGNPTPVVHRDVSPQNLFVTVDGICKVLDFGVSKMMTDGPRTRSGVIKGKLPYMAPEQIRGEPIDGRADVFSLGVCAWEALAGARLFDRETDFMIWKAITEEDVPAIATRWPECPPAVDAVIRRALDRDREQRPATARDFATALREAAGTIAAAPEIADAVRLRCGEQLARRASEVATAASAKRGPADASTDFDAAETLEQRAVRNKTAATTRQDSVTLDLTREGRGRSRSGEAAATRDLRSHSGERERERTSGARPRRIATPADSTGDDDDIAALLPERRVGLRVVVIIAIAAAALTAAIVVYLMTGDDEDAVTPAPPAVPTPLVAPADAAVLELPDAEVIEVPVDAGAVKADVKKPIRKPAVKSDPRSKPAPRDKPGARYVDPWSERPPPPVKPATTTPPPVKPPTPTPPAPDPDTPI